MAVPRILTAVEYGRIPTFEHQMNVQPSGHILQLTARLFIAAGLERHYGVGILHRHFDLPSETILVHSKSQGLIETCQVRRLSEIHLASLRAHSCYLNEAGEIQPYEYDLDSTRPELNADFLEKFRALLVQNGLADTLAIIPNLNAPEELFEFQLADDSGMITIPKSMVETADLQDTIPVATGWTFSLEDGVVQVRAVQKCTPQTSGFHKKTN